MQKFIYSSCMVSRHASTCAERLRGGSETAIDDYYRARLYVPIAVHQLRDGRVSAVARLQQGWNFTNLVSNALTHIMMITKQYIYMK